jgi:hypothetical protein
MARRGQGAIGDFFVLDTSSLGTRHHASSDELDGICTPPKKGGSIAMVLACSTPCGRLWRRLW